MNFFSDMQINLHFIASKRISWVQWINNIHFFQRQCKNSSSNNFELLYSQFVIFCITMNKRSNFIITGFFIMKLHFYVCISPSFDYFISQIILISLHLIRSFFMSCVIQYIYIDTYLVSDSLLASPWIFLASPYIFHLWFFLTHHSQVLSSLLLVIKSSSSLLLPHFLVRWGVLFSHSFPPTLRSSPSS